MQEADSRECTTPDNRKIGRRNRFFRRKQMGVEEFRLEQRYFIERRHLINRTVIGWGVVGGFHLPSEPPLARVGPGFALDRHGREVVLVDETALAPANLMLLARVDNCWRPEDLGRCKPGRYVLAVHYAERWMDDANVGGPCGCERPEKCFVCETAVFSIRPLGEDKCPCAEESCGKDASPPRACTCCAPDACSGSGSRHACLCQWVDAAPAIREVDGLCEWNGYRVALSDAVDLGCISVEEADDKCHPIKVGGIDDACGPRRIVKGNDLLHDLVRGCDLTRIVEVSWQDWFNKDRVAWDTFADMFADTANGRTKFAVTFSRPVRRVTLDRHAIVMTAICRKSATGWYEERRIPIRELDSGPATPDGMTTQCHVVVSSHWLHDEIPPEADSWLAGRDFSFEIEIRGDQILDCHGLRVDAEAGSRSLPTPSGNGSPGGTFRSCFRVQGKQTPVDPES